MGNTDAVLELRRTPELTQLSGFINRGLPSSPFAV